MSTACTGTRIGRTIVVASVVATLLAALASTAQAGDGTYRDRWQMKKATNASRLNHERRRVDLSRALSDLARRHSLKMAREGELFHTANPGKYYLQGRTWRYWGENVGVTGGNVGGLEKAFMASAPHRANILNRTFRHVAIGTVRRDGMLWVTVFFWG
ncbi:MAG: CAP domain-containing protein [Planctomycetaceae bacterium]